MEKIVILKQGVWYLTSTDQIYIILYDPTSMHPNTLNETAVYLGQVD